MKTGTTYLQKLMVANRGALLEAGVLFPTENGRWRLQSDAVREKAGMPFPDIGRNVEGAWGRLHRQIQAHPGTSVVSMEFMSFVDARGASRFVAAIPDADVHVVLGVRDARAVIPAVWQTGARNGGVRSWTEFVEDLTAEPVDRQGPAWRRFQRTQGVPRMLAAWSAAVPASRVHVVTVPPRGTSPALLWKRFATVLGVDPSVAAYLPEQVNESLGHPSAELMRLVNLELGHERRGAVRTASKHVLAAEILVRRTEEQRVLGDARLSSFGAGWNAVVRDAIEATGVRLVGDLDDLPLVSEQLGRRLSEPTTEEVLDAAAFAVVSLRRRIAQKAGPRAGPSVVEFLAEVPADPAWDPRRLWRRAADPVRAAIASVAAAVRAYGAARPAG